MKSSQPHLPRRNCEPKPQIGKGFFPPFKPPCAPELLVVYLCFFFVHMGAFPTLIVGKAPMIFQVSWTGLIDNNRY